MAVKTHKPVIVAVAVAGPVIVGVHVHGNATVGVIERFNESPRRQIADSLDVMKVGGLVDAEQDVQGIELLERVVATRKVVDP